MNLYAYLQGNPIDDADPMGTKSSKKKRPSLLVRAKSAAKGAVSAVGRGAMGALHWVGGLPHRAIDKLAGKGPDVFANANPYWKGALHQWGRGAKGVMDTAIDAGAWAVAGAAAGALGDAAEGEALAGSGLAEIEVADYEQAQNVALEWLEQKGFKAELPTPSRFPRESPGPPRGMMTSDGKIGFRVEFDERSGAHINVWAGKEKGPHIRFPGDERTVRKIIRRFSR